MIFSLETFPRVGFNTLVCRSKNDNVRNPAMKYLRFVHRLWAMAFVTFSPVATAVLVDAVAATVGHEVILYSDVIGEIQGQLNEMRDTAPSQLSFDRQSETLIKETLDQAIESKILYREAQLLGIEVDDETIQERVNQLRDMYETTEQFLDELSAAGETLSDFRVRLRKRMMSQRMGLFKIREFEREVVVAETDVVEYYETHSGDFTRPERVRVRQIFIRVGGDSAQRAKAQARLNMLREELAAGADFSELAQAYSQAPGAEDGGVIGWQQRGDLVQELEDAVFALNVGEVTRAVETRGGLHILRLDQKQFAGLAPLEEVRTEIEPLLRSKGAEQRYLKWIGDLRKRSHVRVFM